MSAVYSLDTGRMCVDLPEAPNRAVVQAWYESHKDFDRYRYDYNLAQKTPSGWLCGDFWCGPKGTERLTCDPFTEVTLFARGLK